jgi:PKD repeat protein
MRTLLVATALLLSTILYACGRQDARAPEPVANTANAGAWQAPLLPLPDIDSLRITAAPPSDGDRLASFPESTLIQNRVTIQLPHLLFEPGASFSAPHPADMAYGIFRFENMTEYAGPAQLQLVWASEPLAGTVFIAAANFDTGHWDWLPVSQHQAQLGSFGPYTNPAGDMYAALAMTGTQSVPLTYAVAGGNVGPYAVIHSDLSQTPNENVAPRTVIFDGSGSSSYGSLSITYDWDFTADGTWEITGATTPTAGFDYTEPGTYACRLRATDDEGGQHTAELHFLLIDPGNIGPAAGVDADVTSGNAPLLVSFDATISSDSDGEIIEYEWDFDDDGYFEYSSGTTPEVEYTLVRTGAQNVYVKVTDNDLADNIAWVTVTVSNGWEFVTVDSDADGGFLDYSPIALVTNGTGVSERLCALYRDVDADQIRFARATTQNANAWAAPVTVYEDPNSRDPVGPALTNIPLGQLPLAVYGESLGNGSVRLVANRSSNTQGSAWVGPSEVAAVVTPGELNEVAIVGGMPTIVTMHRQAGEEQILYLRATNANGTNWSPPEQLPPTQGGNVAGLALLAVSGLPLVASMSYDVGVDTWMGLTTSVNAGGSAWTEPVILSGGGLNVDLCYVGTNPAACTFDEGNVCYARSTDTQGNAWPGALLEFEGGGYSGRVSMAVFDGKPAVALYANDDLIVVQAVDSTGTAWGLPWTIDSVGPVGDGCTMEVVGSVPVILYYDLDDNDVRAAYWD